MSISIRQHKTQRRALRKEKNAQKKTEEKITGVI
jgi:hypothetical protein